MKAFEFESSITEEEITRDDSAWRTAGRRTFESAYYPEDAVYEQLIDDAVPR